MDEIYSIFKKGTKYYSREFRNDMKNKRNYFILSIFDDLNEITSVQDVHCKTLLHLSAAFGNITITHRLIILGCNIDATDNDGNTPLLVAMSLHRWEVAKCLIRVGANLFKKNKWGIYPQQYIKFPQNLASTIISDLIAKGRICYIINKLKFIDEKSSTQLAHFRKAGQNIERYHTLMSSYEKLKVTDLHLTEAILYNNKPLIELCLKSGIDPLEQDKNGFTALHAANFSDDYTSRQMVLDYSYTVDVIDKRKRTPLHVASVSNFQYMEQLLSRGADINTSDDLGRRCLNCITRSHYLTFADPNESLFYNNALEIVLINSDSFYPLLLDILERNNFYMRINRPLLVTCIKYCALAEVLGLCNDAYDILENKNNKRLRDYYEQCKREISNMKRRKLFDIVTLFDIVSRSEDKIVSYCRNERILQSFNNIRLSRDFPTYHKLLKRKISKASERLRVINKFSVFLSRLLHFEEPVTERILDFISSYELHRMNLKR